MVTRQVRWNRFTDKGEQVRMNQTYFFAILNEPKEIGRIEQRILEQFSHFDDFLLREDFGIPHSNGLHCKIFSFSTDVVQIPSQEAIYKGTFVKDRDLYERKNGDWEAYAGSLF